MIKKYFSKALLLVKTKGFTKLQNAKVLILSVDNIKSVKKLNSSKIQYASIWKSYGDKFARKFQENLKKQKFHRDFKIIFSPKKLQCKELIILALQQANFGLRLTSETITIILKRRI